MGRKDIIMELSDIHINADLGEDYGRYRLVDLDEILPYLQACNIACGFHAGDPPTIDKTLAKAKEHQIQVGAHPSYPDLQGFGRRSMQIPREELTSIIRYQISALQGMAKSHELSLSHVKPHGALYNDAAKNQAVAEAVCQAVQSISKALVLFVPPGSVIEQVASKSGIKVFREVFLDRTYEDDLSLTPRSISNSVIQDPYKAKAQALSIAKDNRVTSTTGKVLTLKAETYCIHGDNPAALDILKTLHE